MGCCQKTTERVYLLSRCLKIMMLENPFTSTREIAKCIYIILETFEYLIGDITYSKFFAFPTSTSDTSMNKGNRQKSDANKKRRIEVKFGQRIKGKMAKKLTFQTLVFNNGKISL